MLKKWYAKLLVLLAVVCAVAAVHPAAQAEAIPEETAQTQTEQTEETAEMSEAALSNYVIASGYCGAEGSEKSLTWTMDSTGTLTISGRGKMADYTQLNADEPASSPWYGYRNRCNRIILKYGVTSIGNYAFSAFKELKEVTLPSTISCIGYQAFVNCSTLPTLTLPNSLKEIKDMAFINCYGLSSIALPNSLTSLGSGAFARCIGLKSLTLSTNLTSISWGAFEGCESLTQLEFPESLESIGVIAFSGCTGLKSLILPEQLSDIETGAFGGCIGVTTLKLPNNLINIGNRAFSGCTGLSGSLMIPQNVKKIGEGAFCGCTGITEFIVDADNTAYWNDKSGALYAASGEFIAWPAGREQDLYVVFRGNVPSAVTRIAESAFDSCKIQTCYIPDSVTRIGQNAFENAENLRKLYFFGNCPTIGNNAFPHRAERKIDVYHQETTTRWTEETWPSIYFTLYSWVAQEENTIQLEHENLTLPLGGTQKLGATVLPEWAEDKSVTWASANMDVAAVFADGTVLGKKAGTTTVTAKTADGGFTASCAVTVEPAPDGVMPVRLDSVCARPGNTVQVRLMLDRNPGFANLSLVIGYDADVMTLTKVENKVTGTTFISSKTYTAQPYTLSWTTVNNNTTTGMLAILTFQIKKDAAYGVYPITVSFNRGPNGTFIDGTHVNYDKDDNALNLRYVGSSADIRAYISGDVNGDGHVDSRDVLYLLRYLAHWEKITVVEKAMNVDGDDVISYKDASRLLKYIAGWDVVLQ